MPRCMRTCSTKRRRVEALFNSAPVYTEEDKTNANTCLLSIKPTFPDGLTLDCSNMVNNIDLNQHQTGCIYIYIYISS